MAQVAAFVNVSISTIRKIVAGKRWAGVKQVSAPSPKGECSQADTDNSDWDTDGDEFTYTQDDMPG